LNNAYVLIPDGYAETAVGASEKAPGTKHKVRVRNTVPPHDVLTVDAWWSTSSDENGFNYMDGNSDQVVHIPKWQIGILMQKR